MVGESKISLFCFSQSHVCGENGVNGTMNVVLASLINMKRIIAKTKNLKNLKEREKNYSRGPWDIARTLMVKQLQEKQTAKKRTVDVIWESANETIAFGHSGQNGAIAKESAVLGAR